MKKATAELKVMVRAIRLDTDGRAYHRRKRAAVKTTLEALRCLKRRFSAETTRWPVPKSEPATLSLMRKVS